MYIYKIHLNLPFWAEAKTSCDLFGPKRSGQRLSHTQFCDNMATPVGEAFMKSLFLVFVERADIFGIDTKVESKDFGFVANDKDDY